MLLLQFLLSQLKDSRRYDERQSQSGDSTSHPHFPMWEILVLSMCRVELLVQEVTNGIPTQSDNRFFG